MSKVIVKAKFIWKTSVILDRARQAAALMGLSVRRERPNGFIAGSQWWWAYELEIWVETRFFTHLHVEARTLKIGYHNKLREKAALFVDAVRNPKNTIATSGLTNTWELRPQNDYDPDDWEGYEDKEEPRQMQLAMQAVRGRQALESLRKNAPAMGVDLGSGQWDQISEITAEALDRAPDNLPFYVSTPMDAERWLGWLHRSWSAIPAMTDSLERAMNQNRARNARWFQENGYGGH